MTALTPAVQDAAYRLGWAMAGAGWTEDDDDDAIRQAIHAGATDFTPAAEAERVEMVREASIERLMTIRPYDGAIHVFLDDTQGQVPDAFDEWARGFGDE